MRFKGILTVMENPGQLHAQYDRHVADTIFCCSNNPKRLINPIFADKQALKM